MKQSPLTKPHTQLRCYRTWSAMRQRCSNPKATGYHNYGGRGIVVCKEWSDSFLPFYEWSIQNGYREELEIDRTNNDGNYEPSNCRWTTDKVQALNQRRTVYVTHNNERLPLKTWCERLGINYKFAYRRYKKGQADYNILFGNGGHNALKRFNDFQERQISEEYKAGNSLMVLAKKWGVSDTGILHILKRQGTETRHKRMDAVLGRIEK